MSIFTYLHGYSHSQKKKFPQILAFFVNCGEKDSENDA